MKNQDNNYVYSKNQFFRFKIRKSLKFNDSDIIRLGKG